MRTLTTILIASTCALSSEACTVDMVSDEAPRGGLVINEIAARGVPTDWFEVLNTSDQPIELSAFVFVDRRGTMARARRFPEVVLAPGQIHVQSVRHAEHGFALGESDGVWLYHFDDRRPVDHVAWAAGASPASGSYARVADGSGRFVTTTPATPGAPNR